MMFAARSKPSAVATLLAVMTTSMVLMTMVGCGNDDSATGDNSNISTNNGSVEDTWMEPSDTSTSYDAAGDAGGDAWIGRRYESALADLGEPATTCSTTIVNADATEGSPQARIFVPNYRIDFDVLSSHQTFREHIHELVHEKVLPCRAPERATVVLFPESMGLQMLLIGDKAHRARQLEQSSQALTSMVSQADAAFQYYGEKFPDTPITNRFLLALTDSVVRATYDTFGQIADRYGIFVSVSVNLPTFEKTTDPAIVERLGDPDYDAHDYVYQATSPEVHNRQILFGPSGEVVDETFKTYLSGIEHDQLEVTPGDFTDLHTIPTPWGRTGVAISTPAWMPDVQDRLDDLGAEIILQPEASVGGWVPPDEDHWEPDRFMLGGWNLVQRSPRATHGYVSQLNGNFFELPVDGQIQMIEKASRQSGSGAFVGQHGPLVGNTFIGPWVVEDPIYDDTTLTLAERRDELRQVSASLLSGATETTEIEHVEGMWAADLRRGPLQSDSDDPGQPDQPAQVQTHPQVASYGDAIYVVSSDGVVGERVLSIQRYEDGALTGEHRQEVPSYDLIRPSLAVAADKLYVVAEVVGDADNRLAFTAFDLVEQAFVDSAKLVDESLVGSWAFHPSIRVSNQVLHLSWIKREGDANRAFYAQTSLDAPFETMSVNTAIEPRPGDRPVLRANQWDARVSVGSHAIAVTWLDFNNWHWEVLVSVSTDGGIGWTQPTRLDAVPAGVEALNSTPTIESLGDRRFLVAWTDARATRPNTRIAARTLTVGADGAIDLDDVHLIGEFASYDRWMWRPAIVVSIGAPSLFYEVLDGDSWALERVGFDANGAPMQAQTVASSSLTAKHFAAADTTPEGVAVAFEEVTPHTRASSEIELIEIAE
jgi:hypothetical protein